MSVRKDQVNVTVLIDGKQAINQLGLLEMQAQDIRTSMKGMKKDTDDFVNASNNLKKVTDDIGKMRDQIGLTGMTMTQLRSTQRDLNKEISNVTAGTPQYNTLKSKIQEVNGVIHQQQTEIRGVGKASEEMSMSMSMLVGGLLEKGIEKGIEFIKDFGSEAIKAFEEADQVTAQLEASLRSTGGAAGLTKEEIMNLSSELQELTNIDHNVTNSAASLLLTFTNVKEQVFKQAIPLIQDMAVKLAGGNNGTLDLKGAAEKVGKALNDPANGMAALKKAGIQFSDEQKNTIAVMQATGNIAGAQAIILGELTKKFAGSAQAAAEAGSSMAKYKVALHELQEIIGGRIKEGYEAMAQSMLLMVNAAREFLEVPLSDKLSEEQGELNGLVIAIQHTNDNQEVRNALIKELQSKYPDFLGNINAENVSNDLLSQKLAEVNKQYVNKIILQKQEEKIQDQARDQADILNDVIEQEKVLAKLVMERQAMSGMVKTEQESITAFYERTREAVSKNFNEITEKEKRLAIGPAIGYLRSYQNELKKASEIGSNLIKERIDLEKRLGIENQKNIQDSVDKDKAAQDAIVDYRKLTKKELQVIAKGTGEFSDEAEAANAELKRRAEIKKALDQRQADELAAAKNIEALKLSLFGKTLDDETERLKQKAANDIQALKGTETQKAEQVKLITQNLNKDIQQLNDEAEKKSLENILGYRNEEAKYDKEVIDKDIAYKLQANDLELANAKGFQKQLLDITLDRLELERKKELANKELTAQQVSIINQKYDALEAQAKKQYLIKVSQDTLQLTQQLVSQIIQLEKNQAQSKIDNDEQAKTNALSALDSEYNSKKISEINYNKKKELLTKEYDTKINALKNEQAKKDHDAAVLQAGLSALLAEVNALAQGGPYYAAAVAAIGLLEVAAVDAAPIPHYADGGFTFSNGGPVNGPTLGLIGEKGPEYVISNPMLQKPEVANFVGIMENMRTARAFANGGFTTSSTLSGSNTFTPAPKSPSYSNNDSKTNNSADQSAILAKLDLAIEAIKAWDGKVFVAYTDIEKAGEIITKVRSNATIQ